MRIYFFLFFFLLLFPMVSASTYLREYDPLASSRGVYTIKQANDLSLVSTVELLDNSDFCGSECYFILRYNVSKFKDIMPYNSFSFMKQIGLSFSDTNIYDLSFYIKTAELWEEYPIYRKDCILDESVKNGTDIYICELIEIGTRRVDKGKWIPFDKQLLFEGSHIIKGVGHKNPADTIDWVLNIDESLPLSEWAIWNDGFIMAYDLDNSIQDNKSFTVPVNYGAAATTGKIGGGYEFEESETDAINLSTNIVLGNNGGMSISVWLKQESQVTPSSAILSANQDLIMGEVQDNPCTNFGVNIHDGVNWFCVGNNQSLVNNQWTHVVFVYNETDLLLYLNGSLVNKLVYSGGMPNEKTEDWKLGEAGAYEWDGIIDMAYFWNRTLTQDEVITLYNNGLGLIYDPSQVGGSNPVPVGGGGGPILPLKNVTRAVWNGISLEEFLKMWNPDVYYKFVDSFKDIFFFKDFVSFPRNIWNFVVFGIKYVLRQPASLVGV